MKKTKQSGFSLIELLIVVAIILIIAAIAIPNLMASRMAANESSAVQESRNITTAQVVYSTQYNIGYSATLPALGDAGGCGAGSVTSTNACLIDSVLASGAKSGYVFVYTPANPDSATHYQSFTVNANPLNAGHSGRRYFFTDQTAVIRANGTTAASVTDSPI
jgi:type IV pilus assembly protein PilA